MEPSDFCECGNEKEFYAPMCDECRRAILEERGDHLCHVALEGRYPRERIE